MQNSIWKLTILAGVIGVGFLFVLQAQNGLNQQDEGEHALVPAQSEGLTGLGPDDPLNSGSGNAASLWPNGAPEQPEPEIVGNVEPGNVEPAIPGASEPDFGPLPDQFEPAADSVATTEEPGGFPPFDPGTAVRPALGGPEETGPAPTIVTVADPDFGPDPFESEPTGPAEAPGTLPLPEPGRIDDRGLPTPSTLVETDDLTPLPESTADSDTTDDPVGGLPLPLPGSEQPALTTVEAPEPLPEFDPGAELVGATADLPGESPEEQAAKLMQEARQAIAAGQLLTAREKAEAAAKFPVVYGPLDVRPEALIARIDAMLDNSAESAPEESPIVGLPEPDPTGLPSNLDVPDSVRPAGPLLTDLPSPFPESNEQESTDAPQTLPLPAPVGTEPAATAVASEADPAFDEDTPNTTITGTTALPGNTPSAKQQPELTIEKIAPSEATLREEMIYSIHIANRGTAHAAQVVVEDHVPKGCRLVGTIPQAELIGTKLLWRLGRLPSGEKTRILVKVVPIEEGEIGSIATVSFVSEVATRTEIRQPESANLRLSMKAPQQANVGQGVVFSFQIENTGSRDAEDVKLQDIIPVGFEHPAGEDLTYDVGTIAAGDKFEIDLELKAVKPGQHTNRAIVKADGANVESVATVEVIENAGLTLSSDASATRPGIVGQRFTQRITATNKSSQPVSGATITLVPAKQIRVISTSEGGTQDQNTATYRWNLPIIGPGESITVEAVAVAAETGKLMSLAQLTQPGQELQNLQIARDIGGVAALHLDLKDVPATAFPGDEFPVVVRLLNRGTSADSDVDFRVVIPPELEFVKARGPVKNMPPETSDGKRQVTFATIPEMGEGASVDFEITLKARDAGRPKLRAEVRSGQLTEPVASEAAIVVIDTAP